MTLPGLVPLATRTAPLRGTGIHTLIPDQQDDTHDTSRCKYTAYRHTPKTKHKHSPCIDFCVCSDKKQRAVVSLMRGVQSDINFRQIRGSSSHYMTALQQTGFRVLSTFPKADPETRSLHTHAYSRVIMWC